MDGKKLLPFSSPLEIPFGLIFPFSTRGVLGLILEKFKSTTAHELICGFLSLSTVAALNLRPTISE
jgi:hypothetical protein